SEGPPLFVKTDRCVQLIESIVTEHTLEVLDIIVVDVGGPIGEFHISSIAVVVEFEWPEALASIWIVNEITDVRPDPLRTEIDQTFEQRRILDVIKVGRLQNCCHRLIAWSNF